MKNKIKKIILMLAISSIFLIQSISVSAINISQTEQNAEIPYKGTLRVYVTEPASRWDNYDKDPYHYGFLDFAIDETLSIDYLDTYTTQVTWIGSEHKDKSGDDFGDITENNIMVIASVFSPVINKGYANPPIKNQFDAHYVDATAGAKPGETGYNTVNEDFTHTVFVEEATATWCSYCPKMAEALNNVYESEDYPFYFVALIADKVNAAKDRLVQDYNIYAYPTSFFDGGKRVLVGGYDDESPYRTRIEQCGSREAHELDLSVSVEWLGDGDLQIEVSITNNEQIINSPPETPSIAGKTSGKAGDEYEYTVSAVDPDGDDVYYWILWFQGCPSVSWQGPYESGEEVTFTHSWSDQGDYTIQVKAKDIYEEESDWTTLSVSMPKSNSLSTRFYELFTQFSLLIKKITNLK